MKVSESQFKFYEKKLEITLLNYFRSFESKTDENLSDCFRYLEKNGNNNFDDDFKNLHERKNILLNTLIKLDIEVQKFYINLKFSEQIKDFYGVKKVINDIIENYDYKMLSNLLMEHNNNIDLKKLQNLNHLSSEVFKELDIFSIHQLFDNYILPKDYIRNISEGLGKNIKLLLNNEKNELEFLDQTLNDMSKILTLSKEKNKLLSINNNISNHLQSKDKKNNNKLQDKINNIEKDILKNNEFRKQPNNNKFFNEYIKNINNLKLEVLNFYFKIGEDKQKKLENEKEYLNKNIENDFFENKLLNFIKNKIENIKYSKKIKLT